MDAWIAQGVDNDDGNWDIRKSDDLIKVWTRWNGSEFNQSLPVIRTEHYFPDIEDPELIRKSLMEYRREWDDSIDRTDEFMEFRTENT